MSLADDLGRVNTLFIDTAPIIYYIEAHPQFGPPVKEVVHAFQSGRLNAFTSVITLAEVLPKPIRAGDEELAKRLIEFLKRGKNLSLVEISADIAEVAGWLRGQYPGLRTIDAIQVFAAMNVGVGAFLTNDTKLKQVKEIKVLVLKDYIHEKHL